MSTLLEVSLPEPGTAGRRPESTRCVRRGFQFARSRDSPAPLGPSARTQTIGFRRDDLEQSHWKKVWRSLFEE